MTIYNLGKLSDKLGEGKVLSTMTPRLGEQYVFVNKMNGRKWRRILIWFDIFN